MFPIRTAILVVFITFWYSYAKADFRDLQTCETHLNKYRRFLLQAILNFEDVCDAYNSGPSVAADNGLPPQIAFIGPYQPPEPKAEIWTILKVLMAQVSDEDFANVLREAVIDRCRQKLNQKFQQRTEKRDTVVLGTKQRFHSWGGKRSGNELNTDHNDITLSY